LDRKASLKAEKERLLALEEAEAGGGKKAPKPKKKGKDDLDFLNAALAEVPKTKAQKQAEEKKKADEERKKKEAEEAVKREERKAAEELERKKAAARGITLDHSDEYMVGNPNRKASEFEEVSGLDAALNLLSTNDTSDEHPERRRKALFNAFYESMLPVLKEDQPGLKLSQYKERIFDMWKTSPENPTNKRSMKLGDQGGEF